MSNPFTKYRPRLIQLTPHGPPSFNGRHNEVKSKCFLVLYNSRLGHGGSYTAKQLASLAGVSYYSLLTLLNRWELWGYVLRRGLRDSKWRISARGIAWLERWQHDMPLERYYSEIEAHHKAKKLK